MHLSCSNRQYRIGCEGYVAKDIFSISIGVCSFPASKDVVIGVIL